MPFPDTASHGVHIASAVASGSVSRRDTLQFSRMLARSIRDEPEIAFPRIREQIRTLLNVPMAFVNRSLDLDRLYPYPTDTEAACIIYLDIRKMLRDATLLGAFVDDQLAGIGGFMEVSRNGGRPVIELRRTALKEEFQGRGIYAALADKRLERVQEEEPDALLINATRQPSVIRWTEANGFAEIDWRRFYIDHKSSEFSKYQQAIFDDRVQRFGWRYFERMQ